MNIYKTLPPIQVISKEIETHEQFINNIIYNKISQRIDFLTSFHAEIDKFIEKRENFYKDMTSYFSKRRKIYFNNTNILAILEESDREFYQNRGKCNRDEIEDDNIHCPVLTNSYICEINEIEYENYAHHMNYKKHCTYYQPNIKVLEKWNKSMATRKEKCNKKIISKALVPFFLKFDSCQDLEESLLLLKRKCFDLQSLIESLHDSIALCLPSKKSNNGKRNQMIKILPLLNGLISSLEQGKVVIHDFFKDKIRTEKLIIEYPNCVSSHKLLDYIIQFNWRRGWLAWNQICNIYTSIYYHLINNKYTDILSYNEIANIK